jgi:YgiT-type zinc finger domain-containing protein
MKKKTKSNPCRCGGSTKLVYQNERSGGVLIKNIPVLVCSKCGRGMVSSGDSENDGGCQRSGKERGRSEDFG